MGRTGPRPPASPSISVRAISMALATLLVVSWTVALFCIVRLHRLEVPSDGRARVDALEIGPGKERREGSEKMAPGNERHLESAVDGGEDVHVVFSTDCSAYQHWQSVASFYSLRRAGHRGPVTRIASGCTPGEEDTIRWEFERIRSKNGGSRPNVHFTPSFSLRGNEYKYSNKPGGMHHWMTHGNDAPREPVVALVDPDMLALRPVLSALGERAPATREGSRDLVEQRDESGTPMLLRNGRLPPLPDRVRDGTAAGQHFGLGGLWASAGTERARRDFREFNLTAVCGAGSPCLNAPPRDGGPYTSRKRADESYAVGPVYIASAADWRSLLPRWHDFTPRVHAQYPKLLAEMFAFTMAAADARLEFALSSSYMVSDPKTMSPTEGWLWIDEYWRTRTPPDGGAKGGRRGGGAMRGVCEGASPRSLPTETTRRLGRYGAGNYGADAARRPAPREGGGGGLPTFLHYCQNYKFAGHSFAKRKMARDFFRCDGSPLELDVDGMTRELDDWERNATLSDADRKKAARTAFMLCHLIPLMNMALDDYKADVCE